jgi:hypothetical protein
VTLVGTVVPQHLKAVRDLVADLIASVFALSASVRAKE